MRGDPAKCAGTGGTVDPLNVILYQYGEWSRMSSHLNPESHYEHTGLTYGTYFVCGCKESNHADCTDVITQQEEKEGHTEFQVYRRSHFRMFPAPHAHTENIDKFTVLDVHHETLTFGSDGKIATHDIDAPWESWEDHLLADGDSCSGISGHWHLVYHDLYMFNAGTTPQGFPDDGLQSRLGGLHNGSYTASPSGTC